MRLAKQVIPRDETATGEHYYQTPIGRLPSVTTILKATGPNQWAAQRHSDSGTANAAKARGRAFHKELEEYFNTGVPPTGTGYFTSLRPFLRRLDEVALVEGPVWHAGGFAGTVDCVAWVDGELSLIDWQSSTRLREEKWLADAHLQVAAYRAAVEENYRVSIRRGFVVIAIAGQDAQVVETTPHEGPWAAFLRRLQTYPTRRAEQPARG